MHYLAQVIQKFQVPELELVKHQFTGYDECLTIWQDPVSRKQYALWERDYMVETKIESSEIERLTHLSLGKPVPVKPEFQPQNMAPELRLETDAYQTRGVNDAFAYELFEVADASRQDSQRVPVKPLDVDGYARVWDAYDLPDLQFKSEDYRDDNYLMQTWADSVGNCFVTWQGWFIECPERERFNIEMLTGRQLGAALPKKKHQHTTELEREEYVLSSRYFDRASRQHLLLFKK